MGRRPKYLKVPQYFCEHCLTPLQKGEERYCSKCVSEYTLSKDYLEHTKEMEIKRICAYCGKVITTNTCDMQRFCDSRCAGLYNTDVSKLNKSLNVCAFCGNDFVTDPLDPYYYENPYCSITCEEYVKTNNFVIKNDLYNLYGRTIGIRNIIRGLKKTQRYRTNAIPITENHPCLNCGNPSDPELVYFCSESCRLEFIGEPLLYRNFSMRRRCPICHDLYNVTQRELLRGQYLCGNPECVSKHRMWYKPIYHNRCIVCGLEYRSAANEITCCDECDERLTQWINGIKVDQPIKNETKEERFKRIMTKYQNEPCIYTDDSVLDCRNT